MRATLLKILFHLFARLPLRVAHALGAALGSLLLVIPNRRVRTARTNVALCFPELGERARAALVRRSVREYAKTFTELGALWTRDRAASERLIRGCEGEEHVHAAMAAGKGLILAIPHLGSWELVGLYGSMHFPMTSLFRTPPMTEMGVIMRRGRERFGARLVAGDSAGIRALYKALERGELVAILPDQVPGSGAGSVFAPFFGHPASTMVLLARLAAKTGATVLFTYAERLAHGAGYRLHFLPAPTAIAGTDMALAATAINAMVERCVRALPQQYQWVYKRFRVQPSGQPDPY
jgi:Kdo2-lipid IVA lauroyltransferase/acyltransferase